MLPPMYPIYIVLQIRCLLISTFISAFTFSYSSTVFSPVS